jgi:hypothetical protein
VEGKIIDALGSKVAGAINSEDLGRCLPDIRAEQDGVYRAALHQKKV